MYCTFNAITHSNFQKGPLPDNPLIGSSDFRKKYKNRNAGDGSPENPFSEYAGQIAIESHADLEYKGGRVLEFQRGPEPREREPFHHSFLVQGAPKPKEPKVLSQRSKSKIRNKVKAWYFAKQKKERYRAHFVMCTLTLTSDQQQAMRNKIESQILMYKDMVSEAKTPLRRANLKRSVRKYQRMHVHEYCNKMLNAWLTKIRKMYDINYIWVAEIQDGKRKKDGGKPTENVHYHILIDRWVNVQVWQHHWKKTLSTYGFQVGENTNPLDVSYMGQDYNRVSTYLTKYITKNESKLYSQIWNCSKKISRLAYGIAKMVCPDEFAKYVNQQTKISGGRLRVKEITEGIFSIPVVKLTQLIKSLIQPVQDFNVNLI